MALAGKRLLVVDDSEELAQLLAAAAGARGAEAVVCSGGRAALAEVDARGADGAFVDLPLKDVRGDAFLLALKDRGVPCVAISGVLKGARYADMARHFGAIGFLEKPFDLDAAFRMLEAAVAAPEPEPELPALTPLPQFPVVTREEAAEASGVWEREAQPSPRPSPAGEFSRQTPVEPGENRAGGARARSPEGDPPPTSEIATASPYAYAYASSSSHSTPTPSPSPDPSPYPSPSPDPSPTLDFDPEHPDFDSIVFSPARPALDETLPGIPLPRRPLEGLAQPLPPTGSAAAARPPRPGLPPLPDGDLAASSVP
ncbi:MAG TPA: response regulator, partial [Anaeromyxobacteraceae bacterium]|nr:response regulator [Anaeromyxobacteraceae bacterium]